MTDILTLKHGTVEMEVHGFTITSIEDSFQHIKILLKNKNSGLI